MKSNSITFLLREAGKYPRLNPAEEAALSAHIRNGDHHALDRFVTCNLRLVLYVVRQYRGIGVDVDDLVSEGLVGLYKAAQKYDPSTGTRFITFAIKIVRQQIQGAIRAQLGAFRIPHHIHHFRRHVQQTESSLEEKLGRAPTDAEIARELNASERRVRRVRTLQSDAIPLDVAVESDEPPLIEKLTGADVQDAATQAELIDDIASMEHHLARLEPRERTILAGRFGLGGGTPETLAAIAMRLGITKERVRQLEEFAIIQLRRVMCEEGALGV